MSQSNKKKKVKKSDGAADSSMAFSSKKLDSENLPTN
jgi:hypothetical protein